MDSPIFEHNNYQLIPIQNTFTLLENSIPILEEITSYKIHTNSIYLLNTALYKLDLFSNQLTLINKSVSSFDSTENALAIGLKSGKLIYQSKISLKFHWHNSPINHTLISNTSNIIITTSDKPIIVFYNLNTQEPRFVLFYGFVTNIISNYNFLTIKSKNLIMNYDMKNEQFNFTIKPERYQIWITNSLEENYILENKINTPLIKSVGIFENPEPKKYLKTNFKTKKKFLIFQDKNILIIYSGNFFYKTIPNLKLFYCSNYLFCKTNETLKIFNSNFVLIEEVFFNEDFESIVYLNKILYFVKNSFLFKGVVCNKKVFITKYDESVKQVFVFKNNFFVIYLNGICTFKDMENVNYETNGILSTKNGFVCLEEESKSEVFKWNEELQDFEVLNFN